MFKRIEDVSTIQNTLRDYCLKISEQKAPFLATINLKYPNLCIEGARPLSIATNENDVVYSLTDSDSKYQQTKYVVKLDNIEFIEIFK